MMRENVKIFAKTIEDEAVAQINNMSRSDAYKDCEIRIMPDCHAGKGCTIGTVIKIHDDKVVPNTIGVDIGCGMLVSELGDIDIDFRKLDDVIRTCIPSGFNIHETAKVTECHALDRIKAPCVDKDMALRSIGSLGGGNHFIEVDTDDAGCKYLVIHSGSRNLGVRICGYYQAMAVDQCRKRASDRTALIEKLKAEGRQREISAAIRALGPVSINNELAYVDGEKSGYYNDMLWCQVYAAQNRKTMMEIICKGMGWKVPKKTIETIHNYVDLYYKIIRKGAVNAEKDRKLIIPINMRDGSLICVGKGNKDWLESAPHGAGRLMSRKKAKDTLTLESYRESMTGIYTSSVSDGTIDEAPMVYKPMDEIMEIIEPTVEIIKVIKPLYNYKASN